MQPRPLPPGLPDGAFSVAEAKSLGVPVRRLHAVDLVAPTHGVRSPEQPGSLLEACRAFAVGLPIDVAFSHVTAAQLHGIPLPGHLTRDAQLDVIRDGDLTRVRRRGCRGHRGLDWRNRTHVEGVRVTALPDTWVDLGEVVPRGLSLDDLIVAGDFVATVLGGKAVLTDMLSLRVRPRGKRLLTRALAEVRWPVRSPMETMTRLMLTRDGAPEPEVNAPVFDTSGEWVLEGDLVWREQRVVVEYQGAVHAPIAARAADAHRARLAQACGWQVVELFAADVLRPTRREDAVARVLAALARTQ